MRIGELKIGEEYAVGKPRSEPARMKLLAIEEVEVEVWGGRMRPAKQRQKVARMRLINDAYYHAPVSIPRTGIDDERYVPARDIRVLWSVAREGAEARRRHREEREREIRALLERRRELLDRATAATGEPLDGRGHLLNRSFEHSHVALSLDELELLVEAIERGKQ